MDPPNGRQPSYHLLSLDRPAHCAGTNSESAANHISKGTIFVLAIAQVMLSLVQLTENLITILVNPLPREHFESRIAMLLMCASDVLWLSTTLLLLFGVLRDEYKFIRPHLYLIPVLLFIELITLVILVTCLSPIYSIVICIMTIVVVTVAFYNERRFLQETQ